MSIRIGDKIVANSKIELNDATEEVSGLIRLATDADIEEGTNTTKAVTPSQLSKAKVQVDNATIEIDNTDGLKAIGLTSKNIYDETPAYVWRGTEEEYNDAWEAGEIEPDWICIITDDGVGPSIDEYTRIYDKALTIQRNGETLGTFTANSDTDVTIDIPVPESIDSDISVETLATSGDIILEDNTVRTIVPIGDINFVLPTITDLTKFHEILIQVQINSIINFNFGTSYFFNKEEPDLTSTGAYNLVYEYDNINNHWVCGSVEKGLAL